MTTTLPRARGRLTRPLSALLRESPTIFPALGATALFVALAASEAGFYPVSTRQSPGLGWYPAAVLMLALLVATAIAVRPPRPLPRSLRIALAGLAGYTLWSYMSIAWAEQQGVAWDGANRTALYLIVFALFALWAPGERAGALLVAALGLGMAGLGLVELLRADASATPELYFVDGRFAEPAGYQNANAALWTIGLWPCLFLAASREANVLLRGLALGGAGLLACLALMAQSRGWVLAAPVAALMFVALMPCRARALAALVAVGAGLAVVGGKALAVHDELSPDRLDGLLADATAAILVLSAVLAAIGVGAALADRRIHLTGGQSRAVNRAAVIALAVLLIAGAGIGLASTGDPVQRLSDSWGDFKAGGSGEAAGGSRFSSVGTNRYDFWSVAWELFRERPLAGFGSENFQAHYLARGNSGEQPRYPHALILGVLSQTGLVGAILLACALVAAGSAALGARRRSPPPAAAVSATAATVFVYWLVHASVDWFWEFAAVTAPAFAMLALAGSIGRFGSAAQRPRSQAGDPAGDPPESARGTSPADARPPTKRRSLVPSAFGFALDRPLQGRSLPSWVGGALALAVAAALLLSLMAPWMAEREMERAAAEWPSATAASFERLDRAGRLNPLSPKPHLVAATIAVQIEDDARATAELREVLRIEPRTPFALAELAALVSQRGDRTQSERLLERARAQAPRDEVIIRTLEQVRSGESIDVRRLNADYLRTARSRVGRE